MILVLSPLSVAIATTGVRTTTWKDIIEFDVYSLFNDVILNPEQYGFANVSEPSLDPLTLVPVGNPDEYLFWDAVHPTSIAHQYLAEFALDALTPTADYVAGLIPQSGDVLTF